MMDIGSSLGVGLLVAALVLGLRHGIDWDHIAAITDITATQSSKRGFVLGTLYALGHAAAVLVIGIVAILIGRSLPPAVDQTMGVVVGWTLVALGLWVVLSLIRNRGEFRMQSRWMLLFAAVRNLSRRFRQHTSREHDHLHVAGIDLHHEEADSDHGQSHGPWQAATHAHSHRHAGELAADYGKVASVGVGVLHGIGAETPTQVLIFLAAANAGGKGTGIAVLLTFLFGLLVSNTVITLATTFGFKAAARRRAFQVTMGAVTAGVSLVIGGLLIAGSEAVLPAIFAG